MPQTGTINSNVINLHHLFPPVVEEEEYADPLTPEEEVTIAIAEQQLAHGEYVEQRDDESVEQFFERITAD